MEKRIKINGQDFDYIINENCEIYSLKTNKILKGSITPSGYKYYRLKSNGKTYRFYAQVLMAICFLNYNQEKGYVVNHIDGNKLNNDISNLEIITQKENMIHANKNNLISKNREKKQIASDLPGEEWKIIKDFPKYAISNFGRVKSFQRKKPIILKPSLVNGYLKVRLTNDNGIKDFLVAYLVYFNFNTDAVILKNFVIDHINGIKTDNNLINLRYISITDNTLEAMYEQNLNSSKKSVGLLDDNGQIIKIYSSCSKAAEELGLDKSSIAHVCRGDYKTTKGYKFCYIK